MQAWLDQQDAHVAAIVRKQGWFIQYVGGATCDVPDCGCDSDEDGPAFAYTIGLFGLHHPELLIMGVPPDVAGGVLNELGRRIKKGATLLPGQLIPFPPRQIIPEEVPNPEEIVFTANRFYGMAEDSSVPVLQLSYDDNEGRFPWEAGYLAPALQPRPGTFRA